MTKSSKVQADRALKARIGPKPYNPKCRSSGRWLVNVDETSPWQHAQYTKPAVPGLNRALRRDKSINLRDNEHPQNARALRMLVRSTSHSRNLYQRITSRHREVSG